MIKMSRTLLIDETLQKLNLLLTLSGVDIENKKSNTNKRIIFYCTFISLNLDIAAAVNYLINGILNGEHFVNITFSAPCIIYCCLSIYKLMTTLYDSEKVQELTKKLRRMETENINNISPKIDSIIKEERSFLHKLIRVLNISYCVLLTGFTFNCLLIMSYNYIKQHQLILELPFLAKYPFNSSNLMVWPFVYIKQVWSVITVILYVVLVDYLFYTYTTYIRIQFRLLQHALETMITDTNIRNFKEIEVRFRKLVTWHIELIESTQQLEAIYTKSTLCNFVTSSALICLTGFDVMVISDVIIVITFVSFLLTSLLQIFFICFFGDLLMTSSMEVSDVVYQSKWYLKDSTVGKSLLIIMIRAQKACKLTAFNFAEVNLSSFMRIMKNAWSYFALLKTVYDLK